MITTEQIKALRDETGVSVMQCKKALEEAGGDAEKALAILKKKSTDIASKKSDRTLGAGLVVIKENAGKAVMSVLYCETDFVAKNDEFIALANKIADIALEKGIEAAKEESTELINLLVQKIGENIKLGDIIEITGSTLGSYVHSGKAGVLVALEGGTPAIARDIAMHIAAMKPEFKSREDIAPDAREAVAALFAEEVAAIEKPEEIKKKILDGKIDTYFKERTLLEQSFIKNPDLTIAALLEQNGNAKLVKFVHITI